MNQTFSITRFGRLLRKYFIDNRGQLLANISLLVGGLTVLAILVYHQYPRAVDTSRYALFFFVGWSAWYVFLMQQTAILNHKERAINYLMQPASQLEKIVLIWLISGLGFVIVYGVIFTLIDSIGIWYINNRHWTLEQLAQIRWQGGLVEVNPFYYEKSISDVAPMWWVFTALFHSVFMMFSLVVRRFTLPLSVVIVFAVLVIGLLVNGYLLHSLTGSTTLGVIFPFMDMSIESPNNTGFRNVNLPQPLGNQIRYAVGITAILLLYITAYVRLKEREV